MAIVAIFLVALLLIVAALFMALRRVQAQHDQAISDHWTANGKQKRAAGWSEPNFREEAPVVLGLLKWLALIGTALFVISVVVSGRLADSDVQIAVLCAAATGGLFLTDLVLRRR